MRATLFKEVGYSLSKLIEDIDIGEIGLPDIQRPFIWTPTKVRDLFDSMYQGFPVGYLLFWANGLANGHRQIGTGAKQKVPRLLIVDGQQRLTSLYAVLKGQPVLRDDYTSSKLYIGFRPHDAKFEVSDAAIRRDPEFISDISRLWAGDVSRNRFVKEFVEQLRESRSVSEEEADALSESIDRLYDLQHYPFTALELSPKVDEEQVATVFVRINSKGVTLKQADFILTLMSVFWDEGRAQLEHFCRFSRQPSTSGPSPFNHYLQPDPDQLLRVGIGVAFRRARLQHVYSLLRGKNLETEVFSEERRIQQFELLKDAQKLVLDLQNWHEFLKALLCAGCRSSTMISSRTVVLYAYVMFCIGKRDFSVEPRELRNVITRWFFMASLTGRYSGSPETIMEADFARLRSVKDAQGFIETLDRVIRDTLTEDFWNITLPNDLAASAGRSPSLFAYYAALNILDANVLFSRMAVSELLDPAVKARKAAIERHHLFPKKYLKRIEVTQRSEINQIANFALVEWRDNIDISDSSPVDYWPKYADLYRKEPDMLKKMCMWHALPEGWEQMEYDDFLASRRILMARVVRQGFEKLWKSEGQDKN